MLKKGFFTTLFVLAFLGLFAPVAALAQTYLFNLDRETVNVFLNQDGTAAIDYVLDFSNDPTASPIDFVDIGLPNSSYDLGTVTADVNGKAVQSIDKADPQNLAGGGSGITLSLGAAAIKPGSSGRVHVTIPIVRRVLYPGTDSSHPDYASFQFSPNYFGSQYVKNGTDLTVIIHLPPGVQSNESVYYPASSGWPGSKDPEASLDSQNRIQYTWSSADANGSSQYTFGAGFPAKYIPAAAIVRGPSFELSQDTLFCLLFGGCFALIIGLIIYAIVVGNRKRKLQYLPPKISIEGHGIKRGLTAVEAAILMEQPMDKILTMVLFSAVKKGAATVVARDPLDIKVTDPLPEGLNDYERDFLAAFRAPDKGERRRLLQDMMINLVKSVSEKMKGFSRKETIAYYQSVIEQAWAQVTAANTPEVKAQKYDEVMDWTMLDRNYGDRTQEVFRGGPVYVPMWWSRYDPVYRSHMGSAPAQTSTQSSGSSSGQSISLPNLPGSDFAASVVNGVQSFSAGVLGDVAAFTSGVTNKTNPIPVSQRTYSSGGGGGHCACACACACAGCACACAGGGR
ncbi:MAG TPA: hypothetical protein VMT46_18695 [Anaerolineaceae bacterium]|nr:hypothetical protein [Anaerolineaceae bacterium]